MPEVKWVSRKSLYDMLYEGEIDVPVLTLDDIEAWLDTQRYARAADGLHVCVEDLLAQVRAWKEGKR